MWLVEIVMMGHRGWLVLPCDQGGGSVDSDPFFCFCGGMLARERTEKRTMSVKEARVALASVEFSRMLGLITKVSSSRLW